MTAYTISSEQSTKFTLYDDGDTLTLQTGVTLDVAGDNALLFASGASNARATIAGTVLNTGAFAAVEIDAVDNYLELKDTGAVHSGASQGVLFNGADGGLDNLGKITGATGVEAYGLFNLDNPGAISGRDYGVRLHADLFTITNDGVIRSNGVAIVAESKSGTEGNLIIHNAEIASKGDVAIRTGAGCETVVNAGQITGDVDLGRGADDFEFGVPSAGDINHVYGNVDLGAGNDSFSNYVHTTPGLATGVIVGKVFGGAGADDYYLGKQKVDIVETAHGGIDTVPSSYRAILPENVEKLDLQGSADASGIGNDGENDLIGNTGNNVLRGLAGNDTLAGGLGDDRLFGGAGADTFQFTDSALNTFDVGHDHIADFDAAGDDHDLIDLRGFVSDFHSVKDIMVQKGDDVVIEVSANNQFIVDGTRIEDLHEKHFLLGFD